jgi:hypothetical protein
VAKVHNGKGSGDYKDDLFHGSGLGCFVFSAIILPLTPTTWQALREK